MNDHQFSNQKSALEEYFESLLAEDEVHEQAEASSSKPDLVQSKSEANTEVVSETSNEADVIAAVSIEEESESVVEEVVSQVSGPLSEKVPGRTTVEEMLAAVEDKVQPVTDELPQTEFAEPESVINIPLPEVAPVVAEAEPVVETQVEIETTTEEVAEIDQQQVEKVSEKVKSEPAVAHTHSEPPEWAEAPFQCLLFEVGGLSLAVPLVRLNGVIPWSENVVETPNQTDWYLGVLMNHGNKVQVIDTAMMVLPEEHRVDMPADPAERLSHILLVDDQRWGLACDCIGDVVWLQKDEVKWRSNKTRRPWLLGTAINHMCAVMDTEAFADMLEGKK